MITTMLRIGFINMRRDRAVQALTFLLPIVFFSIFATVFGQQRDPTRKVPVAVVDEDQSEYSKALVAGLRAEGGLDVRLAADKGAGAPYDRAAAEKLVKGGDLSVALVLPKGLGEHVQLFAPDPNAPKVLMLTDASDPIAPQMVLGLLQKVSFTAAPTAMADSGIAMFSKYAGGLTPSQQQSVDAWKADLAKGGGAGGGGAQAVGLPTETVSLMQDESDNGSLVSFYAAGVGVMFLLFSSSGGAGTLLEEEESGTLSRLLGSRLGMGGVLLGKWLFLGLTGALQLVIMFIWGQLVFGLPLTRHVPGFVVMTVFTAAAAAGFGMLLATIARSRAQLSSISTIIILSMSAVGGSMFPRFLMSDTMQTLGLVTFNAWALDGYIKVFWRNASVLELWPQVLVLAALTAVFMGLARVFARRWETL